MQLLIFLLGVIAAIAGYIFSNFFLKPISKYHDIRAKIGYKLTYYSHIITSPGGGQLASEAQPIIRDLACDLERRYLSIPIRRVVEALKVIPAEDDIIAAKGQLILLSNSLDRTGRTDENHVALGKVFTLLRIKELKNGSMVQAGEIYGRHNN